MRVPGSLLETFITHSGTTAVLVIDEDSSSSGADETGSAHQAAANATARQQRVIAVAQRFGCPVILVQYDHFGVATPGISTAPPADATRTQLRGLLPHNTPILTKQQPNAFNGTGLQHHLATNHPGINRLLIMGWNANACVASTVGVWDFFANNDPGATHLGYTLMSCDDVLHGGPANWPDNSGQTCRAAIEFYATL